MEGMPIQDMWQIPYICQFIKLFRGSLNMEPVSPEELEQSLQAPEQTALCSELFTKLLLKRGSSRRDLPSGEGYTLEKWHAMLAKQLCSWYHLHQRFVREGALENFSAAQKIPISMFEELGENPFLATSSLEEECEIQCEAPQQLHEGVRATRSKTNSLPRARNTSYAADFVDHSSDLEDEGKMRGIHEIKEAQRVVVLYALCMYKLETDEELVHELNYVPVEQQRILPIGTDSQRTLYYYFNNCDARIYQEKEGRFALVARTVEQVRELIAVLQNSESYELARVLTNLLPELEENERERSKRTLANLRKINCSTSKTRTVEQDYDDSDFSPVEEDYVQERRGPGRPRKFQLPEHKPKLMPETNGDQLVLNGVLKKIMTQTEVLLSLTGEWQIPGKEPGAFKFIKYSQELSGLYSGYWEYFSNTIEETIELKIKGNDVTGSGENLFGIFSLQGTFEYEHTLPVLGEVVMGRLRLSRTYLKLDVEGESSCSEAELEIYDEVKPLFKLEFEQKVLLEYIKMPLKNVKDLKRSLRAQEKRELRRVPFYKSESLNS